jgi:Rieske Fe-S protein
VRDVHHGAPTVVETETGALHARAVILATHLPFEDQGLFFAKAHPQRSYAVAGPIAPDDTPDGMFINVDSPTRSLRTTPNREETLLIVGGEGHKTGEASDTREPYARLEEWARDQFGLEAFPYRWATHDYISVDKAPFVGRLVPWHSDVWVATGYGKWGMTNGTAAAILLTDLLTGRKNPWTDFFSPHRARSFLSRSLLSENAKVAQHFVADRLRLPGREQLDALSPGEGAVFRLEGETLAISRGEGDSLTALSPRCTHLGCYVAWNRAEQTWDCPCHGSRFLADGSLIQGPAVDDLSPHPLPKIVDIS